MSITPHSAPAAQSASPGRGRFWQRRIWAICFTIFALEIGLFLMIFPWMDSWDINHLQRWSPRLEDWWRDPYLRGAVSGLGLVNVYIACREAFRLIRRRS